MVCTTETLTITSAAVEDYTGREIFRDGHRYRYYGDSRQPGETFKAVHIVTSGPSLTVDPRRARVRMFRNRAPALEILNEASTGRLTRRGEFCRLTSEGVETLRSAGIPTFNQGAQG